MATKAAEQVSPLEMVHPDKLTVHPENPRVGNIAGIVDSIEANGWFGTVSAQVSTGHVIVGNHRFQAGVEAGMDAIPTYWVDCDDETAKRIMLVDNRISDAATNDDERVLAILTELKDGGGLEGSGFDEDDIDMLATLMTDEGADLDFDSFGDVRDGKTPAERKEEWEGAGVRSIILPYPLDIYESVLEGLKKQRAEMGVDSNADVIARFLGL